MQRARAPAGRSVTIGVFAPQSFGAVGGLRGGLRELGYIQDWNVHLEFRWAEGSAERLADVVAELVRSGVDVLVIYSTPPSLAAQKATSTVPIILAAVGDPLGSGLVATLPRPGGNITGFSSESMELEVKRLQLMTELLPNAAHIALLWNPTNPPVVVAEAAVRNAARTLKLSTE